MSTKKAITRKIKIGNLVFPSIQPILDLSCKFEKYIHIFKILNNIFFSQGNQENIFGYPPAPPNGAAPLDPAFFWIEDSSQNRFALNGIQRIFCYSVFLLQKSKTWVFLFFSRLRSNFFFFKSIQIYIKEPQLAEYK